MEAVCRELGNSPDDVTRMQLVMPFITALMEYTTPGHLVQGLRTTLAVYCRPGERVTGVYSGCLMLYKAPIPPDFQHVDVLAQCVKHLYWYVREGEVLLLGHEALVLDAIGNLTVNVRCITLLSAAEKDALRKRIMEFSRQNGRTKKRDKLLLTLMLPLEVPPRP